MGPAVDRGADLERIARGYRGFARHCAAGGSPVYARICEEVARDGEVLGLVASLPRGGKRQPNLLLGVVRYLGGPVQGWGPWRAWLVGNWERVRRVVMERRTQTNEVRRCAVLLPVLAGVPGPLALLEVGASAGLCLYPDRYRYSFDGGAQVGPAGSPVLLECATSGGVPVPERVPRVVWRAGVDLNPLDAGEEGDVRWLEALVWPGREEAGRRARLRGAASVVAADPPLLVEGDLVERVGAVAALAPAGATLVVFHSAVLAYLSQERREEFVRVVGALEGHWVANEGWRVFAGWENAEPVVETDFTVAVDGRVVAYAGEHGQSLTWV
ncbi:DUF2332 domain-containing protein [Nocardiopsis sp. CA-288880]|uniref:DUF2332 domain-containing protein n=1 Tax=Nocardiopsis sp. CA-288880 TaxID=3239995 RepID=UPI003D99C89A